MGQGLLFVTMQPKDGLQLDEFNDWYNNEHGPTRLRFPFIQNGYRYRATDLDGAGKGQPEWLAIYDITNMEELTKDAYTSLRLPENKTQRETDVMKRIDVGRHLYDRLTETSVTDFVDIDTIESIGKGNILVTVTSKVLPLAVAKHVGSWFNEDHIPQFSRTSGWKRSRYYTTPKTSPDENRGFVAVHEFEPGNTFDQDDGTKILAFSPRYADVEQYISQRNYSLYYTFGPAPRELNVTTDFLSRDGFTRTESPNIVESHITTDDSVLIPYRLEGAREDTAPLILLSNCILTEYGLWDGFVREFLQSKPQYRILRYNTRGRASNSGDQIITLDVLASDIIALLDALRVPKAILIGDSLGGATILNTALEYPERVSALISCDTNALSPSGNRKAWGDRITMADKEAASAFAEAIVGDGLAEITTQRWFHDQNSSELARIKEMVRTNSLLGFKKVVNALFDYDLREKMKSATVKAMFVVGAQDGVLPDTMKEMSSSYGTGAEYTVIDDAGHLPMVEKPLEFARAVERFLTQHTSSI